MPRTARVAPKDYEEFFGLLTKMHALAGEKHSIGRPKRLKRKIEPSPFSSINP